MRTILACALGALLLTGCATASPPSHARHANFHGQRQDGGGARGGGLFVSPMGEPFRATASAPSAIGLWFAEADTDHDGKISRAEFLANAQAFYTRLDANADQAVTSLESTDFWRVNAPEIVGEVDMSAPIEGNAGQPPTSHGHHSSGGNAQMMEGSLTSDRMARHHAPAPRGIGAQSYGLLGDAEPVMSCDADFDRRITPTEFQACADRRFALLDANHDGFFAPDEAHMWRATAHDQP